MKHSKFTKGLAALLVIVMVIGLLPVMAGAYVNRLNGGALYFQATTGYWYNTDSMWACFDNVKTGTTITLEEDATINCFDDSDTPGGFSEYPILTGRKVVLDLNGKTLTYNSLAWKIADGAELEIKNGTIISGANPLLNISGTGKLKIDADVTIKSSGTHVAQVNGSAVLDIYGKITAKNDGFIAGLLEALGGTPTINVYDGAVLEDDAFSGDMINGKSYATVNISGGIVRGTNYYRADISGKVVNITGGYFGDAVTPAEGYVCVSDSTQQACQYKVVSKEELESLPDVAQIGTEKYKSLNEAITAATKGDTIVLLADHSGNLVISNGKEITIDLNGYSKKGGYIDNYAVLTIIDSSEGKTGTCANFYNNENDDVLTFYGGTATNITNYGGCSATIKIYGGSFGFDPTAYVDTANYAVTDNGNETWTVSEKAPAAPDPVIVEPVVEENIVIDPDEAPGEGKINVTTGGEAVSDEAKAVIKDEAQSLAETTAKVAVTTAADLNKAVAGKEDIVETALKNAAKAQGETMTDEEISKQIKIDLTAMKVTVAQGAATKVTSNTVEYDVKPLVTTTIIKDGAAPVTVTTQIPNEAITEPIPFRLGVDNAAAGQWAKVTRRENGQTAEQAVDLGTYPVQGNATDGYYVELASDHFSIFSATLTDTAPSVTWGYEQDSGIFMGNTIVRFLFDTGLKNAGTIEEAKVVIVDFSKLTNFEEDKIIGKGAVEVQNGNKGVAFYGDIKGPAADFEGKNISAYGYVKLVNVEAPCWSAKQEMNEIKNRSLTSYNNWDQN